MPKNLLDRETSPYLLQHKDNPVHWHAWGTEALERAKRENKPILLSVGYAACHWCHVMAHESFEDAYTAELMNQLFVNIKVDREERPDLDQIYQTALQLLGEQGGWPLTMFLTPGGEPFWGGTYFPPIPRYGRPGFREVLIALAAAYRDDPEKVQKNVAAIKDALQQMAQPQGGAALPPDLARRAAERLVQEVDPVWGGIGGAPKFPQVPIFTLLWRACKASRNEVLRNAVRLTLTRMAQGGIYDHLGGGFARYSVDAEWLVPHFEKMLYDNAALLELMVTVWQDTKDPLLEQRIRETVGWVMREMVAEGGGFAASLDADSEGEEGKFYVWTEAEIDAALPAALAEPFKRAYDVSAEGNWEGKTILHRNRAPELGDAASEARLAEARRILFEVRATRVRPGWDDKVLADWNGLMIAALAEAGAVFDEPDWIAAAQRAFAFVRDTMATGGRLRHSWRLGQARHPGTLDDHAHMARAALALHEATGDGAFLDQARAWVEILDRHFWDDDAGGYFFTADDTADVIQRAKNANDNATPSGNGTLVEVLARLHYLTGEDRCRTRAEAIVAAFSGAVLRTVFPFATLINGHDFLQNAVQIVLVGQPGDPALEGLARAVYDRSVPNRLVIRTAQGAELPANHPAAGKAPVKGKAAAYVCRGQTCSLPIAEPEALIKALQF
ncbi:MAG TPA: thioredoxin domain-containing protein [Methylomirabilota bacterium]|nr:thioredoxin domain-containing protein [Methylomirabilota bacterium]